MAQSNAIRRQVFIQEQHVSPEIEYENEEEGHYYLLIVDGVPVGTARWRTTPAGIKLERFAMLKPWRNKGLGSILLEAVLEDVLPKGRPVYLHAQLAAVNYYLRAGFTEEGDRFTEAGIVHVKMRYTG